MRKARNAWARLAGVLGLLVILPAMTQAEEGLQLDLVTHNSVVIEASPAEIWPRIIDPSEWKTGARLVVMEGDPAATGAVFKAVMPDTPDQVLFHTTNVEVVPEQRRAVRLNATDGALMGFAIWELSPAEGSTEVAYHVYSQATVSEAALAGMSEADRAAMQADYTPSNFKRFQAELETLKGLVETPKTE